MRFVQLDAIAFGPLQDRLLELDSDIVLVTGPNEAGKSSFRAALETVLYGFKPALRDQHPLAQWNPEQPQNLQLEAELKLDTGEIHAVERVLLQTGKSRLASGGAAFVGPRQGNSALPWVAWLSREIFRALYSLEISQLAALDPGVRDNVDSLLLPQTHALPLRSIAEVRAELEQDHLELWRPDNRGKPAAKRLRAALSEARSRASEAGETERDLRAARVERAERESSLAELQERKRALDREQADAPLLGELFELNRRRRRLGAAVDLSALAELPLIPPSQLGLEIEQLQSRLREPKARLELPERSLEVRHESVSVAAVEIERAIAEEASWRADGLRRDEQRRAVRGLRERAADELAAGLAGSDEDALTRSSAVPLEALGAIQASWSEARERHAEQLARFSVRMRSAAAAVGIAGLAGIVCGSAGLIDSRAVPAGAVLVFGSLLMSLFSRPPGRAQQPPAPEELGALLGDLSVAEPLLRSPAALERLVALLGGVQRLLAEARATERAADALDAAVRESERSWLELCRKVGVEFDGPGDLLVGRLRAALEAARAAAERVRQDRAERAEAVRLCERDAPLLERKCEHRQRVETALRSLEPGCSGLDDAFERVQERLAEEDFLRRRLSELREAPRFGLLEGDRRTAAQRAPEDAPWLPEIAAIREADLAALEEQIGAEQRRLGELSELLAGGEGSRLARATDSLREVEAELAEVERKRDRLALLDSLLARADREYREAHQPDVLRRASLYLERVTLGRYRRVDFLDDGAGLLGVTAAGRSEPVAVGAPLSQGTLDQIFLCLRLGLLDHLDEERERLPLALDDTLLRMDDQRRRAVYALLADIAPVRQVFLLTCHSALADEVAAELKVRRIDL